jgi:predicted nucleotidyltransferase
MSRPQEIDPFLTTLLAEIQAQLSANLVGVYLRGSLVMGDFRPESSDIDLLAVTEQLVSDAEFARLAALHSLISQSDHPFAQRLEITYIDRAGLRRYQPGRRFPTLGQGEGETLQWTEHLSNWVLERWMVREHGISLFGPPPKTLIDPIEAEEFYGVVRARLQDWVEWASDINDPEWHWPRSHKAYVVETMCRALYTLAHGEIGSKPHSAAWARQTLPEPWRSLVERSQSWRTDNTLDDSLIIPVRAFVMWTAERAVL